MFSSPQKSNIPDRSEDRLATKKRSTRERHVSPKALDKRTRAKLGTIGLSALCWTDQRPQIHARAACGAWVAERPCLQQPSRHQSQMHPPSTQQTDRHRSIARPAKKVDLLVGPTHTWSGHNTPAHISLSAPPPPSTPASLYFCWARGSSDQRARQPLANKHRQEQKGTSAPCLTFMAKEQTKSWPQSSRPAMPSSSAPWSKKPVLPASAVPWQRKCHGSTHHHRREQSAANG